MQLDPITIGILIALGSDIVIRTWSTFRRRVVISSPMSDRLDNLSLEIKAVGETLTRIEGIQKEASKDFCMLFTATEALLIHARNGDSSEASDKIDATYNEFSAYLKTKLWKETVA